jgi:hypothetical protein
MNALREKAEGGAVWSGGTNAALLPWDGDFIFLSWYKNRGSVDRALVLSGLTSGIRPFTLADAEDVLEGLK